MKKCWQIVQIFDPPRTAEFIKPSVENAAMISNAPKMFLSFWMMFIIFKRTIICPPVIVVVDNRKSYDKYCRRCITLECEF